MYHVDGDFAHPGDVDQRFHVDLVGEPNDCVGDVDRMVTDSFQLGYDFQCRNDVP